MPVKPLPSITKFTFQNHAKRIIIHITLQISNQQTAYLAFPSQHLGKCGRTLISPSPISRPPCLSTHSSIPLTPFSSPISTSSPSLPTRTSPLVIPNSTNRRSCFDNIKSFILFQDGLCLE